MTIPPSVVLAPDSSSIDESVPAAPGIYSLSISGRPDHLGWSTNLRARLRRLFADRPVGSASIRGRLRELISSVEYWPTSSKLERILLGYTLTKHHFPDDYLARLRLRMPWFIGLSTRDAFPRLVTPNKIPQDRGGLFGPFATRDLAQNYQEEVLRLFQIRRCTEKLQPSPEHPGCMYGEMNQCLRPCQCRVTPEEYATEVARVSEFLATNGKTPIAMLLASRERASESMDFELAAQLHRRIEHIQHAASARDELVREIGRFNGVALTRSAFVKQFRLWPMLAGEWQDPVTVDISIEGFAAKSLDAHLREILSNTIKTQPEGHTASEDLALFLRWYRSSWRDGEWFPFTTVFDLNYRKLVRAISKLVTENAPCSS